MVRGLPTPAPEASEDPRAGGTAWLRTARCRLGPQAPPAHPGSRSFKLPTLASVLGLGEKWGETTILLLGRERLRSKDQPQLYHGGAIEVPVEKPERPGVGDEVCALKHDHNDQRERAGRRPRLRGRWARARETLVSWNVWGRGTEEAEAGSQDRGHGGWDARQGM